MNVLPAEEEFLALAARGFTLIPVYAELIADAETPISAFLKLGGQGPAYLLESAERGERVGRYSFLGFEPLWTAVSRGGATEVAASRAEAAATDGAGGGVPAPAVARGAGSKVLAGNPLAALRVLLSRERVAPVEGLPPFFGGAVGYLSYDVVRHLERLPEPPPADPELPEAAFMATEVVVAFDHLLHRLFVVANCPVAGDPRGAYRRGVTRIEETVRRLGASVAAGLLPAGLADQVGGDSDAEVVFRPARGAFLAAVERAKEYIRAGDIFQVVLSVRHERPLSVAPFQVYRALRALNPSPYLFYLDFGDLQLVGSSPEMLVRVSGEAGGARVVETRPIAGTRPRGRTEDEDRELERELLADAKERAEHVMLVDLGRNDVGRVAVPGTVRAPELFRVERYSHVMHLVSDVQGVLREDRDAFDALAACFPAGTLTGAPKIRAMEIIDELEPVRRGPYGGCVAYFGFSGNMDSCIAIRTVVVTDGVAYVQAGAGIVADSVPEREWEECRNKARALLRALAVAEREAVAV